MESGKRHKNRPQLLAALELCKKKKAKLVIAKLDRLSRNVAFMSSLMESGVDFVCCDNPHATKLMLHMLAAFAEHEREQISERIRAALGRVKADLAVSGSRISLSGRSYTKLGGPRLEEARRIAAAIKRASAPSHHTTELMSQLRGEGSTLRAIAQYLNSLGIRTPQGARWHASTVSSVLSRMHASTIARQNETDEEREHESTQERKRERVTWRMHDFVHASSPSGLNAPLTRAMPSNLAASAGRTATLEGCTEMYDTNEASRMVDTFASVGAMHFNLTFTDIDGEHCGFRRDQTARQFRNSLPHLLPGLTERKQNLIVRPSSEKVTFVQLDDLTTEQLQPLASVSCLILETSPGNHQAWVAITDLLPLEAKDFGRRLRKGTGADATASGATRVAGTLNFKRKYEPAFPMVNIRQASPGRVATKAQLEALGLVAAAEPVTAAKPFRTASSGGSWPDYQRCVLGAPMKHGENTPDISRADFFYAMMCAQRGHSVEAIAGRLMDLSSKAEENGERYAQLTAESAVAAADRQRRSRA